MVTPLGGNVAMTSAAVNAGISAYGLSSYQTDEGKPITMARVPNRIFAEFLGEIDEGDRFNPRHDRVVKMAIIALQEACANKSTEQPVPLVLAMPDVRGDDQGLSSLVENIAANIQPWVSAEISRGIHSGRASGIEAIDFVFKYIYNSDYPFVLVGGSDCHEDYSRLMPLENEGRLLTAASTDGFALGEAASFLLLTPIIDLALIRDGNVIALFPPGIADEKGHLFSDEPYRGEGLDQAFKKAFVNQPEKNIHSIYSSMNGESHWAKEYGVAYLRNRKMFKESVRTEHPADCYGDVGSATATTLIILAAEHLFKNNNAKSHLVYCSSDTAKRGALVVEKINVNTTKDAQE